MYHEKTSHAARGKWKGILMALGVPAGSLTGKHGPCPICNDGVDRFRFDNKDQRGTYICNHCGAGDGMSLAMAYTGKTFTDVASEIDAILGNVKIDKDQPRQRMSDEEQKALLRRVFSETRVVQPGDLVHKYLTSRGVEEMIYPKALRFHPSMQDGEGGLRPCMVAMVGVFGEAKFVTMHRTFLRPDGLAKAEMAAPRKLMPCELPDGACVQLSGYSGGPLGIAEGIETAMAASAIYSMPVWAAINARMLEKWTPPEGCDEVSIFGDNDAKFGGQSAAYRLAHTLAVKNRTVSVHIPPNEGQDWNDVLMNKWKG